VILFVPAHPPGGSACKVYFSSTASIEVQPPGAVARLVLCLPARAVTMELIGVAGVLQDYAA